MYCIDIITLIINNIIHKIICRLHQTAARSRSAHAQCDKKRGRWRREVQILCNNCATMCNTVQHCAASLQLLCNTAQQCATLCSFSATSVQLLCNRTKSACARRLFFLQRRDSPRAFCCDCASQCLGSGGKKYIACAPCGCFKRIKPRAVLFWISYVYYWADPALFWFFSSSHLKHMFKICHRSPTISYFNKSQDNEV